MGAATAEHALATTLGTPRAASWDPAWLAFVDETEQRLNRRICGAHAPDGEPCELASTHPNGRCRFHGGHPRIGGQPGNTNALLHGLYSRRLRPCNDTCPAWHTCPFAGADVMTLAERKRPICAYEREAYAIAMHISDADWSYGDSGVPAAELATSPASPFGSGAEMRENIVTQLQYRSTPFFGSNKGATTKFPRNADGTLANTSDAAVVSTPSTKSTSSTGPQPPTADPAPSIIDDTGAILYAMLQRATLTVSAQQLTEQTEAISERYTFRSNKLSAAVTAFLRIGRELRAWLKLRPAPVGVIPESAGFGDDADRPELNEHGYTQFYDHKGNKIGLPALMHPFLHELDAAVAQLRTEGIRIPPPEATK